MISYKKLFCLLFVFIFLSSVVCGKVDSYGEALEKLGKPDSDGIYEYKNRWPPFSTEIYYKQDNDGFWEWSPDKEHWMSSETITVSGGKYNGKTPVSGQVAVIEQLAERDNEIKEYEKNNDIDLDTGSYADHQVTHNDDDGSTVVHDSEGELVENYVVYIDENSGLQHAKKSDVPENAERLAAYNNKEEAEAAVETVNVEAKKLSAAAEAEKEKVAAAEAEKEKAAAAEAEAAQQRLQEAKENLNLALTKVQTFLEKTIASYNSNKASTESSPSSTLKYDKDKNTLKAGGKKYDFSDTMYEDRFKTEGGQVQFKGDDGEWVEVSSTVTFDGKRIESIDGGYKVTNQPTAQQQYAIDSLDESSPNYDSHLKDIGFIDGVILQHQNGETIQLNNGFVEYVDKKGITQSVRFSEAGLVAGNFKITKQNIQTHNEYMTMLKKEGIFLSSDENKFQMDGDGKILGTSGLTNSDYTIKYDNDDFVIQYHEDDEEYNKKVTYSITNNNNGSRDVKRTYETGMLSTNYQNHETYNETTKYDMNGNYAGKTRQITYRDDDGKEKNSGTFTYDKNNNVVYENDGKKTPLVETGISKTKKPLHTNGNLGTTNGRDVYEKNNEGEWEKNKKTH